MVRVSPSPPRMTSWCATRPRIRRPWTRMPSTSAPRAPSSAGRGRVGHRAEPGLAAGGRDQLRRTPRGAGGRVGLVRVVQLDDLDRLVERRGRRGEPHHQDRADREVRARSARRSPGESRQPAAQRVQPLLVEAGGADDGVDAVVDAELQVVHDDVGVGEVDDRLGARRSTSSSSVVADVDLRPPARGPSAASTARHTSDPTLPRAPSTPTSHRCAHAGQPSVVAAHAGWR